MKRSFIFWTIVFITVIAFLPNVHARGNLSIRVQIMVQADADIQAAIENQLKKQFRSLDDVVLVNEKPDFEIRVIVMGSAMKEKENTGVAFSTVFLSPYIRSGIPDLLNRCKGDKEVLKINEGFAKAQIYKDHLLQVGSPKDIEEICKDIAYNFKTNVLEDYRLTLQNR